MTEDFSDRDKQRLTDSNAAIPYTSELKLPMK